MKFPMPVSVLKKSSDGVTLVELLVGIGIMSIIVLIVVNLFISSGRFSSAEQLRIDVSEKAARVLSGLDETLREARAVITSANYSSVTYTTGDTTVVLTTPSLLADGSLSLSDTDTVIVYRDTSDPDNIALRRIIAALGTGSTRTTGSTTLVQGVKDVYFRYTTDVPTETTVVSATVTTETSVNNRPFTAAMILNATLRNHP